MHSIIVTCLVICVSAAAETSYKNVPQIIFETDMTFDVDDVGALAMLNALADAGEVSILAVMYNEVHVSGASAIAAINSWYGRGDVPIGVFEGQLNRPDESKYLSALAEFPREPFKPRVLDAQSLYREILAAAADGTVTIASVGFLNNIAELLRREEKLVRNKVKELVLMGGLVNDSFNFVRHNLSEETQFVIENWPTPVVVSDFGSEVGTGMQLADSPGANPVRNAYFLWFGGSFKQRSSWDQVAVLYAVRGLNNYFELVTEGRGRLRSGFSWSLNETDRHYIKPKLPVTEFERLIEQLMITPPL